MAEEVMLRFHWADYLILALSLSVSVSIGIYYAIIDRKKQNNEEFLMAGRNMSIGPVTASTFATLVSCFGIIAYPVEIYYFGFGYFFTLVGAMLAIIPVAEIIAPAFHRMNLISAFQYLEERFNSKVRKGASFLQLVLMVFYLGMLAYAPAVTLAQVSGVSAPVGIVITCVVCCIYTTFGGMKAVVWSDTVQMFLMFGGVILLFFKSVADLGGFKQAFQIIHEGGRIDQFTWSLDPFLRSSVWGYLFGGFLQTFVSLSSTQMTIQRYCTLRNVRDVKISVYLMIPMCIVYFMFIILSGCTLYGTFATCDPQAAGHVKQVDQMIPFMVMKVLGPWKGLSGLFVAAVFAAALSSLSSGQNAIGATILSDFVQPIYHKRTGKQLRERTGFLIAKGLVLVTGLITAMMAFLILALGGGLFALIYKILGVILGPVGGLFSIAILMKSITEVRAVMIGFVTAICIGLLFGIGGTFVKPTLDILPISISGCPLPLALDPNATLWMSNMTLDSNVWSTTDVMRHNYSSHSTTAHICPTNPSISAHSGPTGINKFFNLNPMLYLLVTYGTTVLVSYLADRIIKCMDRRRENKEEEIHEKVVNGYKYDAVLTKNQPKWAKEEESKRLSKLPPQSLIRRETSTQTAQSIHPDAKQDILWVYDKESNI